MNDNQAERFVVAFEKIASTLEAWYKVEHPDPKIPREAVKSYVKTPTSELEEDLGKTGEETIEEWTSLGYRERHFLDKEKK